MSKQLEAELIASLYDDSIEVEPDPAVNALMSPKLNPSLKTNGSTG